MLDISIISCRKNGEKRKSQFKPKSRKNVDFKEMKAHNPYGTLMNHRKHEAKIYREANGGIEQSFYRYYGVLSE